MASFLPRTCLLNPPLQVGLLNVDGYYNSLLSFIDQAVEEGFVSPSARHIIISAPTAKELVMKLEVIHNQTRKKKHISLLPLWRKNPSFTQGSDAIRIQIPLCFLNLVGIYTLP